MPPLLTPPQRKVVDLTVEVGANLTVGVENTTSLNLSRPGR
jgi:hypothetical protein